jgi:hypothetical protein
MTRLSEVLPLTPNEVLMVEVGNAASNGLIQVRGTTVTVSSESTLPVVAESTQETEPPRLLRAVVVDVESVVRLDPDAPEYRDARIWQIGAVRLSGDTAWEQNNPRFARHVTLPEGWQDSWNSDWQRLGSIPRILRRR